MKLWKEFLTAVLMTIVTTVIFGLAYPLVVTGVAQALFPAQANGSLITRNGHIIGSGLIGQPFVSPAYFHPRPSAAGPAGYDASASTGTNFGPTNQALVKAVHDRVEAARKDNPGVPVPIDLVTSSASGLDPDLSPAAALFQVPRVARARHVDEATIRALVAQSIQKRQFGILGEPRVNVLELNLALDDRYPMRRSGGEHRQ